MMLADEMDSIASVGKLHRAIPGHHTSLLTAPDRFDFHFCRAGIEGCGADFYPTMFRNGKSAMEKKFMEYVPVLETHNAGDRVLIKSILDAEGIIYFIQGEHVAPYLFNALPMRVMVNKEQADRARQILSGIEWSNSYGFR